MKKQVPEGAKPGDEISVFDLCQRLGGRTVTECTTGIPGSLVGETDASGREVAKIGTLPWTGEGFIPVPFREQTQIRY